MVVIRTYIKNDILDQYVNGQFKDIYLRFEKNPFTGLVYFKKRNEKSKDTISIVTHEV